MLSHDLSQCIEYVPRSFVCIKCVLLHAHELFALCCLRGACHSISSSCSHKGRARFPCIKTHQCSSCNPHSLTQLPLLISTYLESMDLLSSALSHHALSLSPSPSLSKSSESLLANRISSLPPGQCVEMMEHFHGYFTQRVNTVGGGAAMGDPLVVNLVPSLEKVADLLSVVLDNVPLSVWTSHLKDKALTALLKLHNEVSLPFLQASYTKVSLSTC